METISNTPTATTGQNCSFSENDGKCLEDFNNIILNSMFDSSTENTLNINNHNPPGSSVNLKPSPLISDELTYILEIAIVVVGLYITSIFGLGANIVNSIVYARQGLKDSITLGLFALSLSDLVLVTLPLITASCHVADYLMPESPVDFPSIHYVSSGWMRNMMYSMSCLITAFLSLERCCCIILPFKVKSIFTRGKTAFVLGIAFLFHLGCLMMLPAAYELTWWPSYNFSVSNNMSRIFRVVFFEEGEVIEVFNTTVMSLVVPTVTQVIVIVCVAVMIHGLRASAKFRQKATVTSEGGHANKAYAVENDFSSSGNSVTQFTDASNYSNTTTTNNITTTTDNPKISGKSSGKNQISSAADQGKSHHSSNNRQNLSGRDARLIKTMIFLVSMQTACNIPFLVATFAWRSIPELNIGMAYENTLRVMFSVVYLLGNLNASCNVFVYYHTSSSFRDALGRMSCCARKKQKK